MNDIKAAITKEMLERAEAAYADGDFWSAELVLANLSRFSSITAIDREGVFARLAGLASQQDQFGAAASWYAHV